MKTESYIVYLEHLAWSLMVEREDLFADIPMCITNDPRFKNSSFSPFNAMSTISDKIKERKDGEDQTNQA